MLYLSKLSLLWVFLANLFLFQTHANQTVNYYYVHLKFSNKAELNKISKVIHIDKIISRSAYSIVNEWDFKRLKKDFSSHIVEWHQYHQFIDQPGTSQDIDYPDKDKSYHTYKEMVQALKDIQSQYPEIAELFSIGKSLEGRDLWGIKLSHTANENYFTPGIAFVGAHHAREHLSAEIPIKLIKFLASSYGKNEEITKLIQTRDIFIIPMVNPDGAMYDIQGKRYKMWRKNRSQNQGGSFGVDLNRNYSFGWGTGGSSKQPTSDVYMGPKPFSEPESQAVKKFVEENDNIRILLSFHTFSELILYPWGGKNSGVGGLDQRVFEKMARDMAVWNKYKPMQASGLYIASGDTCDWAYGAQGIFCFTFELSPKNMWTGGFYPGDIINKVFQANIKPALYLIKHAANPRAVVEDKWKHLH